MDALLQYGSGAESTDESELSDQPPAKRGKSAAAAAAAAGSSPPSATDLQQRPSLLPSAAELLDGSYSPPPAAQQQAVHRALHQALHQGRIRTFPHVPGNYPTLVYIEVETPQRCLPALDALLQLLHARLPGLQPMLHAPPTTASSGSSSSGGMQVAPPHAAAALCAAQGHAEVAAQRAYHVSLSRTVPVRLHQVEPLVEALRRRLRQQDTFCIRMVQPEVLVNDEGTRTFLSLAAGSCASPAPAGSGAVPAGQVGPRPTAAHGTGLPGGSSQVQAGCQPGRGTEQRQAAAATAATAAAAATEEGKQCYEQPAQAGQQAAASQEQAPAPERYSPALVSLCHAVSSVFAEHGLPQFYADPRPHASVAWLLGDVRQQLEAALTLPEAQEASQQLAAQAWQLCPATIVCKSGQRVYTIWQPSDAASSGNKRPKRL